MSRGEKFVTILMAMILIATIGSILAVAKMTSEINMEPQRITVVPTIEEIQAQKELVEKNLETSKRLEESINKLDSLIKTIETKSNDESQVGESRKGNHQIVQRHAELKEKYGYLYEYLDGNQKIVRDCMDHSFIEMVDDLCKEKDFNPYLIFGIIRAESNFSRTSTSSVGAMGLMQFMPDTALWVYNEKLYPSGDINKIYMTEETMERLSYDPEINVRMGIWYLTWLSEQHGGDLDAVLKEYSGDSDPDYYHYTIKSFMDEMGHPWNGNYGYQ